MIAIDNAPLVSNTSGIGIPPVDLSLFVPAATWAYNSGAKTVTVTDASTITSPDTFDKGNVSVSDRNGGTVFGNITTATGTTGALDVSSLDLTGPLTIQVTLSSSLGVQASGQANWVNATNDAGSIGFWAVTASTDLGA